MIITLLCAPSGHQMSDKLTESSETERGEFKSCQLDFDERPTTINDLTSFIVLFFKTITNDYRSIRYNGRPVFDNQ